MTFCLALALPSIGLVAADRKVTVTTAADWEDLASGKPAKEYPTLPPILKLASIGDTWLVGGGPHDPARTWFIRELRKLVVFDEPHIRATAELCAPIIRDAFFLTPSMLPAARLMLVFPGSTLGVPGPGFGRVTVNWATGIVDTPPPNTYEAGVAGLDDSELDRLLNTHLARIGRLEPGAIAECVDRLCSAVAERVPQLVSREHDIIYNFRTPDGQLHTWSNEEGE